MKNFQVLKVSLFVAVFALISSQNLSASDQPKKLNSIQLFDGETLFGIKHKDAQVQNGSIVLGKKETESYVEFEQLPYCFEFGFEIKTEGSAVLRLPIENGQDDVLIKSPDWTTIHGEITVINNEIQAVVKSTSKDQALHNVKNSLRGQSVSLRLHTIGEQHQASIRNVFLRPTQMKDLFNGKDLKSWKLFTGDEKKQKSQFEVTPNKEIRVLNGPGDLQTESQYADFCMQFDCKTNGKLLNSGIFFRCLPDQYQQGYEAQIQNGFKDNDRTKPVDFGTGAIYRRTPTRKVVPDDGEWFTMTILVTGPRIRTWVNSYPTVDWTDDRPANTNARSGKKLDAGPISIQGHDPTTDILFRNLKISDMTKAK
jgi:hypothetical protein